MEREEKTDFILEQVRLCLDKKDFIKAQILSNKILKRTLTEPTFQDLKIRFYSQMIRYFLHENKFLDVCKSFMAMYDTPKVKSDENSWKEVCFFFFYFCLCDGFFYVCLFIIHYLLFIIFVFFFLVFANECFVCMSLFIRQ